MAIRSLIYLLLGLGSYSCFSTSLNKPLEVNEKEDWLMIGGNPEKTNISKSPGILNPPFKLYWQYNVDGGLARNCLSASDAVLFVSTLNEEQYSLDIFSGKSLGRINTHGASFSTPLVFKNNIILCSSGDRDSRIFSYNLIIGENMWKRNVKWVESSPVLKDNSILVSNTSGELYKLNASTGSIAWKAKTGKRLSSFYTSPAVSDDNAFLGSNDSYMYAFELKHGKLIWKFKTGGPVFCDAALFNGRLYFGSDDRNFYCMDTSGNLIWKKFLNTKYLSSPTFYRETVIISGIDGNVYSLDTAGGNIKWKFGSYGTISASPLLHGDKIFIGSYDKNFYCLNAENGKELWKYLCDARIHTSAVIWKEYIFAASDDKYVYCFK